MKKFKSMLAVMLAMICSFGATSCDDDDNDIDTIADITDGTYIGTMTCTMMGIDSIFNDVTVEIDDIDNLNLVNVKIHAFGGKMFSLPTINVKEISVSAGDGGAVILKDKEFSNQVQMGSTLKSYSGTLRGTVKGKTLDMEMAIKMGTMPQALVCKFIGIDD